MAAVENLRSFYLDTSIYFFPLFLVIDAKLEPWRDQLPCPSE